MATKKKAAPKKKPAPKKAKPTASPEEKADPVDILTLQVASKSLEAAELKLQLAQASIEKLQIEKQTMEEQMKRLISQANEKYQLTAGKDRLDLSTGAITRG